MDFKVVGGSPRREAAEEERSDVYYEEALGFGALNVDVGAFVVVAAVVVAAVRLPVVHDDVLDRDEGLTGRVLGREDREPREHGPHAVILTDVVGARAEGLFAANERRVVLLALHLLRVHQVAKELLAHRYLKERDAKLLPNQVDGV